MSVDRAIALAGLVAELGEVCGRKRLQKIVHLLKESGAGPFQYRFILHYFGPFSHELASDLDFLCGAKLVKEDPPEGGTGPYSYSPPSAHLKDRIREVCGESQDEPDWIPRAKLLDEEETHSLEALSTVVFLSRRGLEGDKLREQFATVKPQLQSDFDSAVKRGQELELLQT